MREIKFRAWNKDIKQFVCWDIQLGFIGTNNIWGPVEQYTGIKDKNGREIYEGDILLGVLATAGRGAVTRKEKPFHFSVVWLRRGFELHAIDRYEHSTYRWYPGIDECEVIGHIHESPELLK